MNASGKWKDGGSVFYLEDLSKCVRISVSNSLSRVTGIKLGKISASSVGSHDSERKQDTGFRASGKVESKTESGNKVLKAQIFKCF